MKSAILALAFAGILSAQYPTYPQSINFPAISDQNLGTPPFAINATASSGLPVTVASNSTNVCTLSGNMVTLVAVGTCSITATQAGNSYYSAAPPVTRTFAVRAAGKAPQTISFPPV